MGGDGDSILHMGAPSAEQFELWCVCPYNSMWLCQQGGPTILCEHNPPTIVPYECTPGNNNLP